MGAVQDQVLVSARHRARPPDHDGSTVRLILCHWQAVPGEPLNVCHQASISAAAMPMRRLARGGQGLAP